MKIVSWNVNSLRSRIIDANTAKCPCKERKILKTSPMGKLIKQVNPDIICLQETKCKDDHSSCFDIAKFDVYWNCAKKAGYSGVSIWCRRSRSRSHKISYTLPGLHAESKHLLDEGRIITLFLPNFVIVNTYAPNTLRAGQRPDKSTNKYKFIKNRINWDRALKRYLVSLKKKYKSVILCGDLNVARGELDLHHGIMTQRKLEKAIKSGEKPSRIKALEKRAAHGIKITKKGGGAGYRLEERAEFEKLLNAGFVDIYRKLYPKEYGFTYWNMVQKHFRKANNGMRIDYFIITPNLLKKVSKVTLYKAIGETKPVASDHAPIVLFLK